MWDDTALIEAYDRAVSFAKEKVAQKMESKNVNAGPSSLFNDPENSTSPSKKKGWKIGDYVRSVYSEDGVIYEAVIESISESNDSCQIKYLGTVYSLISCKFLFQK